MTGDDANGRLLIILSWEMENCLDEVAERNGLYIFYTRNHNPGELRPMGNVVMRWYQSSLSKVLTNITSNSFAFHYFLSTNTHFKKKINSPKISVMKEKKKSVTASICKGKS